MIFKNELGSSGKKVADLVCVFPIVLQEHLKGVHHPHKAEMFLEAEDIKTIARAANKPLYVTNKMAYILKSIDYSNSWGPRERIAVLKLVENLSAHISGCERLVQTPVPLEYVRQTSRFLAIWILILPFVLKEIGITVIPVMGIIAWALFGIQEIGLLIEDPFRTQLKLDIFVDTIHADVFQMMGSTTIPTFYESNPFFANFPQQEVDPKP